MTRRALVLSLSLLIVASLQVVRTHADGLASAQVTSVIADASGKPVMGATASGGAVLHVETTVNGGPASQPTGSVEATAYAAAGCAGMGTALGTTPLAPVTLDTSHAIDIANAAGADSATTWVANGAPQLATNWNGSLFAGNDLANFASSSMGWVFRGVPLARDDHIDRAYLSLRIRKSRPNLSSEAAGTWTTKIAADTSDASGFDGSSRAAFLGRFNSPATAWQIPFSASEPDPFGTNDGEAWAASPDITTAVAARLDGPTWGPGGGIAVGLLNAGTNAIAEAQVVDAPGSAVLHIEWTAHETVQRAISPGWTASAGEFSYRSHYGGDATYAAADGPCVALLITPPDADGDGYTDADETALAKNPDVYCTAMRADVNSDRMVNILDLSFVANDYEQLAPTVPERLDQNADGRINILDLSTIAGVYGQSIEACP
jgi:hypothetical protein